MPVIKNSKNFLYALDIGSKKMTLAAAEVRKTGELGPIMVEACPSRGIFKGVVNDLAALSDGIRDVFEKMERRCAHKALRLALSISGNYVNARNSTSAIALSERGTRSIIKRDIERLNQQARTLGLELNEHLLHEFPQGYSIDRHNTTLNPLGLHGRRFGMDLLLICAETGYIENIAKAVEQAGLDIARLVFSSVAASAAVLSDEETEKGVILVDIGDALTSILIFKDGVPRRVHVLSFGGRNLSEIIANYLKVPLDVADGVKESSLEIEPEIPEAEEVMVETEEATWPVKKKELVAVVLPEIEKFLATLKSIVFECGVEGISGMPIVVTGGLSLLEGLLERMERDLGHPVKMGMPKGLQDIPASKAPAYAAAIGLLYMQRDAFLSAGQKLQSEGKNKLAKVLDYLTNLYQDYF